jgi:hypothetical protein
MLDAEPKRFIFFHQSERLLRKKPSRAQRKANAAIEADFKRAATKDAALFNFECLHGPVSVFLHIHEPVTGDSPLIPPVAKAYIDALQGIAYKDDRQVEHLLVRHDSHRHPMLKGGPTEDDSAQGDGAGVFIDVEPVGDYAVRYDHAFNRGLWRRGPSPFRATWGPKKEKELREMRWRRKSGADLNEELLRIYEEEKLRDGFLADIDRPGPLPEVTQKMHRFLPVPKLHHFLRRRAKAMLILPLPGAGKGTSEVWEEVVDTALDQFAATRPGLPFRGFVALDIAVRGQSLHGKDLDNLAHSLLIPIEEKLCVRRGTVVDYRVYAAVGEPEGVQLRVIDHLRLLELTALLHEIEVKAPLTERLKRWVEEQNADG